MVSSCDAGAPADATMRIGGYGSRIALATLACPGRRELIQFKQQRTHLRVLAARCARVVRTNAARKTEGAGKAGCRLHPWVPCNKKHGGRTTGSTGITPAFPAQWFYGFLRALLGDRALLPPSLSQVALRKLDASVGASGPHDFAVRVSAIRQRRRPRPPHPAPNVRDVRNAPLSGRDGGGYRSDLGWRQRGIFLRNGLDSEIAKQPVRQITHLRRLLFQVHLVSARAPRQPSEFSRDHFPIEQVCRSLSATQNPAPSLKGRPAQTQPLGGSGTMTGIGSNIDAACDPPSGDGAGWA
jgi:hypothetical protein